MFAFVSLADVSILADFSFTTRDFFFSQDLSVWPVATISDVPEDDHYHHHHNQQQQQHHQLTSKGFLHPKATSGHFPEGLDFSNLSTRGHDLPLLLLQTKSKFPNIFFPLGYSSFYSA